MTFVTDETWTPARYRAALDAWRANAPANDNALLPRKASTPKPRHAELADKLRSLLTWRAACSGADWTSIAANDNGEPDPQLLDCELETRPSIKELQQEYEPHVKDKLDVEYHRGVAVAGDIAHGTARGPAYAASRINGNKAPRRGYRIMKRIRALEFSNGRQVEPAIVLREGQPVHGQVRMPTGALVRWKGYRPVERFRAAKGEQPAPVEITLNVGGHNPGAITFEDPVAEAQEAACVRAAVLPETAAILDLALRAANFRQIGESMGHSGKHAERQGKQRLIAACEELDAALAA